MIWEISTPVGGHMDARNQGRQGMDRFGNGF